MTARTRHALETETATILAGFEAEKLYAGKPDYFGAGAKVYATPRGCS